MYHRPWIDDLYEWSLVIPRPRTIKTSIYCLCVENGITRGIENKNEGDTQLNRLRD